MEIYIIEKMKATDLNDIKLGDEICRNNYINHYRVIGLNSKLKLQEIRVFY
jgi:hypothetical protein